MPRQFGKIN